MTANCQDKSYTVRCRPLKQDKTYFAGKETIKFTASMRDLGVQFSSDGSYKDQIAVARTKAAHKANWVLRAFQNRSPDFFRIIKKALIQPHFDYGSPIWAPKTQKDMTSIEDVLRSFTGKWPAVSQDHYWDRLRNLGIRSCEHRRECYMILYVFKILRKEVDDPGCLYTRHSAKRDLTLKNTFKLAGKPGLKKVIEGSLGAKDVKLFNSLPR